jgi:Cu-Zn family superoxide dismutase
MTSPVFRFALLGAVLSGSVTSATAWAQHADHQQQTVAAPTRAVAVLVPTAGSSVRGVVTFAATDGGGVRITAQVEGLPAGAHGFHIHEFGDCSGADGMTAGGHFNPEGAAHAAPDAASRHVGDLGNLTADAQGRATYEQTDTQVSLTGPHGVVGRGVIVHAQPDDFTTQPTGAAGARVACGVIGIAK